MMGRIGVPLIEEMAVYPRIVFYKVQGQDKADSPALFAWQERVTARPVVRTALDLGKEWDRKPEPLAQDAGHALFGNDRR